jgi:hypothetical protein
MNKQEAIKKIDRTLSLPRPIISFPYNYEDGLRYAKHIINQIDEPEKPVIPQFVAEWIETYKKQGKTLYTVMDAVHYSNHPCKDWFESNQETFAHAWLNGYEVEKEKQYTARLKVVTIKKAGYLNRNNKNGSIIIDTSYTAGGQYQVYFTHSELEELGIWDNPVFEIEEVE